MRPPTPFMTFSENIREAMVLTEPRIVLSALRIARQVTGHRWFWIGNPETGYRLTTAKSNGRRRFIANIGLNAPAPHDAA